MMMSEVLKSSDFTKIQKSRNLENQTLFFLQIKKFINSESRTTLWKKCYVAEVTLGLFSFNFICVFPFVTSYVEKDFV